MPRTKEVAAIKREYRKKGYSAKRAEYIAKATAYGKEKRKKKK